MYVTYLVVYTGIMFNVIPWIYKWTGLLFIGGVVISLGFEIWGLVWTFTSKCVRKSSSGRFVLVHLVYCQLFSLHFPAFGDADHRFDHIHKSGLRHHAKETQEAKEEEGRYQS